MQYNCISLRLLNTSGNDSQIGSKQKNFCVGDFTQSCYYSHFKSKYGSIFSSRLTITNQKGLSWKKSSSQVEHMHYNIRNKYFCNALPSTNSVYDIPLH